MLCRDNMYLIYSSIDFVNWKYLFYMYIYSFVVFIIILRNDSQTI